MVRTLGWIGSALILVLASNASAQAPEEEPPLEEAVEAPPEEELPLVEPEVEPSDWGENPSTAPQYRDPLDPAEDPNVDYFFLGAFYRHVMIPKFIQELVIEGGFDADNPGVGLTFNWRKNNFNVIADVWWNNAQGSGYFRGANDPRTDTEYIEATMGVLFVNATFLWSFPLTDWFALELGFDLGVGFIYGNITRTEAYESSPGEDDWQACSGPGQDNPAYCDSPPAPDPCWAHDGGHYDCTEPNWGTGDTASGDSGQTPIVIPWVAVPHLAVRFKPLHQLQIRLEGGWGIYNFFAGGSVSYGF